MKETISYEDFKKLDIRIGKVLVAEKVEGADKLIRTEVDFGEKTLQIVSGLAEYVEAGDLVGRKFPYLINLEPRVIRGVESQGMILAIGGEEFSLLEPSNQDLPLGSVVS